MSDLASRVEHVRDAAAKFYLVDLHLHSPRSPDWDNSGADRNPDLDKIPVGEEILPESIAAFREACLRSGRRVVAVTDHNRCSYGLAAVRTNGGDDLTILPGIELSVAFSTAPLIKDLRIHVVAVFPESTHREAFARILPPGTKPEEDRDPREVVKFDSVQSLVDAVHQEKGLAIAAHIESKNGLRGVYRNTAELMLEPIGGTPEMQAILRTLGDHVKDELAKFDCIQVKPTTDFVHYLGPDGALRVPLVVCSDCHSRADLAAQGTATVCYVKMGTASFEGLAEAIKFADSRIRFPAVLPETRPPRLLGLRLVSKKVTENSFFDDTVLGFSDNLTCLIGPRGSGKSASIDALRYLMGYNRSLSEIPKVSQQVVDRQKHTLEKTRIEALYECSDGKVYCIGGTYDPREPYVAEVTGMDGKKVSIEDVELSGEFPLNLYGWSELELLAENPDTQREMLDRFIPDVPRKKAEKGELYVQLGGKVDECIALAKQMDRFFTDPKRDFQRLEEYKAEFDTLNTPEIENVFAELDSIQRRRGILAKLRGRLDERALDEAAAKPVGLGLLLSDEAVSDWASEFAKRLKPDEIDDAMRNAAAECSKQIGLAKSLVDSEDEKQAALEEAAEAAIKGAVGDLETVSADLRNNAKQRYLRAKTNQDEYLVLYGQFKALLDERSRIVDSIKECNHVIYATRNEKTDWIREQVSLVEDEDYNIGLVLEQQGDRSLFLDAMKVDSVVFPGQWRKAKRAETVAARMLPFEFVDAVMARDPEPLQGLKLTEMEKTYEIDKKYAKELIAENCPVTDLEGVGALRVDVEKLERLLELEKVPTDDSFFITLGGKPIQHCSPGQRCSAMLPIVTLTSQAPLVIDQPEDNLDNRLVSRALFKILSRLKETRQIILATHNPNILVSGDAEQVLLLDSNGDLASYGSIDLPEIIKAVIGLMEGGAEAFSRRRMKYEDYL